MHDVIFPPQGKVKGGMGVKLFIISSSSSTVHIIIELVFTTSMNAATEPLEVRNSRLDMSPHTYILIAGGCEWVFAWLCPSPNAV